ncbi:MAG: hypothetical protein ABS85_02325 [Sphingobacteriales bacterium SCN 48-20]|uniref:hypothetical protein n=1 Tax=Terrimonas ferruginea TaxID=249 RepID=UPI00086B7AB8|nr:hypothetical protein [Terrimonas ferruginea]MBN8781551.1 hypothetical protein [Terrimonas ferruginea]ODT94883.1 MAG: hypothetical protein ABS85_02325 [Sphingobacteriales bacterium SCN 48-20]OJW44713.1 MAG: hypothetical protein BGO56_14720 [Sphingobacteriales bacterium 48-107]
MSTLADKKQFSFRKGFLSFFFGSDRVAAFRRKLYQRTNEEALTGDWQAIGKDMWSAFWNLEAQIKHRDNVNNPSASKQIKNE